MTYFLTLNSALGNEITQHQNQKTTLSNEYRHCERDLEKVLSDTEKAENEIDEALRDITQLKAKVKGKLEKG